MPILALAILLGSPVRGAECSAAPTQLCLQGERFLVEVVYVLPGREGKASAQSISDRSSAFSFFDADNLEVVVKILDRRPVNGHYWLFAGAATTLEFELTVSDLATGEIRRWRRKDFPAGSFADIRAFRAAARDSTTTGDASVAGMLSLRRGESQWPPLVPSVTVSNANARPCTAAEGRLCLGDGRFSIDARWQSGPLEPALPAGARQLSPSSGYLWFLRESNPEVLVKILDGRRVNGSFWVFYASLSDFAFDISIADSGSGREVVYRNSVGTLASVSDLDAFRDSPRPPLAPTITEPPVDGSVVAAWDVHMESAPIDDPDGNDHFCSDFEIWRSARSPDDLIERVWSSSCVVGLEKRHIHLGDGDFEGSRAQQNFLEPRASHVLRVRYRDDTGVWGPWAERRFETDVGLVVRPFELSSVSSDISWFDASGDEIVLPPASTPPSLVVETGHGEVLAEIRAYDGAANLVFLSSPLVMEQPVRLRFDGGSMRGTLDLPESRLRLSEAKRHLEGIDTVYLPALRVAPGNPTIVWVAENGSTFAGFADQREPDFSEMLRHLPVPWRPSQPGLAVDRVASGFRLPVNIAFLPSPEQGADSLHFYVAELYGTVKWAQRDGLVGEFATGLLNFDPVGNFPGSGEIGLAGIVVDPQSGDLFVSTAYRLDGTNEDFSGRVLRLVSLDGGRSIDEVSIVLDLAPDLVSASHQISNLSLGPDGMLYVHTGDGLQPERSRDPQSYLGKILRLHTDGSAPADNPFYDPEDGIDATDYVYALGLRNPFGGAWRAADGSHYTVENGPSVDRLGRVAPGSDFGWDVDGDGVGTDDEMRQLAVYNWGPPAHSPVNIVFLQRETFDGSGFPQAHLDHAFVSEFGQTFLPGSIPTGKRITEFAIDEDGRLVAGPLDVLEYIGYGRTSITALAAGPDGLYFSEFFADLDADPLAPVASIWRIRAAPGQE